MVVLNLYMVNHTDFKPVHISVDKRLGNLWNDHAMYSEIKGWWLKDGQETVNDWLYQSNPSYCDLKYIWEESDSSWYRSIAL